MGACPSRSLARNAALTGAVFTRCSGRRRFHPLPRYRGSPRTRRCPGGCSGPRLALALDAPGDDDQVFTEQGHTFCINKELLSQTGAVKVDLTYMGFTVESANELEGSGGGCGGCASAGGCSSH